jgi:MFS family permease
MADPEKQATPEKQAVVPEKMSLPEKTAPEMAPEMAPEKATPRDTSPESAPSTTDTLWPAEKLSLPREALLVAVVCMAQFCTQSAYMGTLVLLRKIGAEFGVAEPSRLAWLIGGYSLTVGTLILFSGRLGDIFGYKRLLVVGFAWFSLWSMIAGLSAYSNYTLAVFSRVLQGVGPAICLPNALAIFGVAYPPGHRKAMVFAFFGAVAPVGGVIGGAIASVLDLVWWPWALWVMAMWLAVLAGIASFAVPELPSNGPLPTSWRGWVEALDLHGAVVGVLALVLFNFAFTQSPIAGWTSPVILVPLIAGLLLFVAFVFIEFRISPRPLLPFDAVNADVGFVLAAVACGWASFGVWTLYLVQILQDVRGLSPLLTIAWFSPVTVSGAMAAVITGKLLGPWGVRPAVVMMLALTFFTIGIVLTASAPSHQIYWAQLFVSMVVMPFGMDMSFPAATLILSDAVAKEHQGIGASLVNTVVNYGIALGVGFAGTVEIHVHGDSAETGYRGAMWMGVGLAGLGMGISAVFLGRDHLLERKR